MFLQSLQAHKDESHVLHRKREFNSTYKISYMENDAGDMEKSLIS